MKYWIISFQPHTTERPEIKRTRLFKNYFGQNDSLRKGDVAFLLAGDYGISGWGYIRTLRKESDGRMFVEIIFDQLQQNLLAQTDITHDKAISVICSRITESFLELQPVDLNTINDRIRAKGFEAPEDLPEFEIHIGKFGVKDAQSLPVKIKAAVEEFDLVSLLFIDLDNFKSVNDNFNHSVGDQVIRSALEMVNTIIRCQGQLFHRSGDEMIVLLPNLDASESFDIAEAIRAGIGSKAFDTIGSGHITASIGVATYPESCDKWEKLEEEGDEALNRVKRSRKNRVGT